MTAERCETVERFVPEPLRTTCCAPLDRSSRSFLPF